MEENRIYRIVNFFDLLNCLEKQQFRIQRTANFPDKNEYLIFHLMFLKAAINSRKIEDAPPNLAEIIYGMSLSLGENIKKSTFTSCWSTVSDSFALWNIYSVAHEGVQIESSISDIKKQIKGFISKENLVDAPEDKKNRPSFNLLCDGLCSYINIFDAVRQELAGQETSLRREDHGYLLKDQSFSHEHEYRFVIEASANESLHGSAYNDYLNNALPSNLFIPFEWDSIRIRIDGACDPWKAETQRKAIARINPRVEIEIAKNIGQSYEREILSQLRSIP